MTAGIHIAHGELPRACRGSAREAWKESKRIRRHARVLWLVFTAWTLFQVGGSIVNASRPASHSGFASFLLWGFQSDHNKAAQVGLLLVPRLLIVVVSYLATSSFLVWIMFHKEEPKDWSLSDFMDEAAYPSVDIFLPRYKEPWSMYGPVVQSALDLDYPPSKLTVWVLDDGHKESVQEHVKTLNFSSGAKCMYLQRPTGNDGKAGNLNYAFKRSSSDIIAVFDADFIIKRHFLMCMLPHMLEPTYERPFEYRLGRCAMVQASQTYYNAENLVVRLLDGALFLAVQLWTPAMNNFGIVHCFGSGYTMRRKALDQVGGWSTYSYAMEDVPTTLEMHQKGWVTKAVDVNYAEGFAPDNLPELYAQRLRWNVGHVHLLCYYFPWQREDLTFTCKASYIIGYYAWALAQLMMGILGILIFSWIAFQAFAGRYNSQGAATSLGQFFAAYFSLFIILLLPKCSLRMKVESMTSMLCFLPMNCWMTLNLFFGRVHPKREGAFKLKRSSEARGTEPMMPAVGWANIFITVFFTVLYSILMVPRVGIVHQPSSYVVLGTQIAFVWFCNWPAIWYLLTKVFGIKSFKFQPPLHDVSSLINRDPHIEPVTISMGSETKNKVADGDDDVLKSMGHVPTSNVKGKSVSLDIEGDISSEETRKVLKALRLGTSVGSSSGSDNGSPRGGQDVADGILDTAYSIESSRPMLERRGSELFRITEHTSTEEQQQSLVPLSPPQPTSVALNSTKPNQLPVRGMRIF